MKKNNKALNFVVTENGMEIITTVQATNRLRKELYKKANQAVGELRKELYLKAKGNLQFIKDHIQFILVSELEKVAGTDFGNYIDKNFDSMVHKDEVNGVNNLKTLVKTVASERGITEPCIAYIEVSGKRLLVADHGIYFLNAEVNYSRDFEYDCWSDKGNTIGGWDHPSVCGYYMKEMEKYKHDYKLISEVTLRESCFCEAATFDKERCKECDFYDQIIDSEWKGTEVIYIKKAV